MSSRMHPDQVATTPQLVRRLVDEQFPQWVDRPLTRIGHPGTDHDVHRLGDDLVVRLPVVAWATGQAELEQRVVVAGLDLRGQHTRRGMPSLAHLTARVEHQRPPAGQGQLPSAGGPYRAAAHDDNIVARSHLYSYETF